jgi:hypothetical protein
MHGSHFVAFVSTSSSSDERNGQSAATISISDASSFFVAWWRLYGGSVSSAPRTHYPLQVQVLAKFGSATFGIHPTPSQPQSSSSLAEGR